MSDRLSAIRNDRPFKAADIILFALLLTAILLLMFAVTPEQGSTVKIYSDGSLIKTMPLEKDDVFQYSYDGHFNTVTVKGGKVSVTDADCPDGLCKNYPPVNSSGAVIICLPHKLVIVIEGEKEFDGIL